MDIFDGSLFTWKTSERRGHSNLEALGLIGFPAVFDIVSQKTGKIARFTIDYDVMEQNEFFDGEAAAYTTGEGQKEVKVQIWT